MVELSSTNAAKFARKAIVPFLKAAVENSAGQRRAGDLGLPSSLVYPWLGHRDDFHSSHQTPAPENAKVTLSI
jgi:hypothetical protein